MPVTVNQTAAYRTTMDSGGRSYHFFCALSGARVCTVGPQAEPDPEKELALAWETEGRRCFNRCHRCGKWVCDAMYNADVLQCVDCAPWESKARFCSQCGSEVSPSDAFCRRCGAKLQYREVESRDL